MIVSYRIYSNGRSFLSTAEGQIDNGAGAAFDRVFKHGPAFVSVQDLHSSPQIVDSDMLLIKSALQGRIQFRQRCLSIAVSVVIHFKPQNFITGYFLEGSFDAEEQDPF